MLLQVDQGFGYEDEKEKNPKYSHGLRFDQINRHAHSTDRDFETLTKAI